MFICLLYNSEVVLDTQFTTNAEVIIVISSQEGNLAICAQRIADGDTQTCFTRELSFGVNAVNSDYGRTSLDVVGSSTNFSLVANVDI